MPKLGVLFNIDDLGDGLYGYEAYKIFFRMIDPRRISGCALYDGDTNATLRRGASEYCIAIESRDHATLNAVRNTIAASTERGLLGPARRFMTDAEVSREPLVLAAGIDAAGELIGCKTGWVTSAHKAALEHWRSSGKPPRAT